MHDKKQVFVKKIINCNPRGVFAAAGRFVFLSIVSVLKGIIMAKFVHLTPPEGFAPRVEVTVCFCEVDGKFLLLQRNDDKVLGGTWVIPGGKVDEGESLEKALAREMLEETGIVLPQDIEYCNKFYVRAFKDEAIPGSIDIDFVLHVFKAKLKELPENVVLSTEEHQAFKWVTPQETLSMNLLPGQDEYIELVYKNE